MQKRCSTISLNITNKLLHGNSERVPLLNVILDRILSKIMANRIWDGVRQSHNQSLGMGRVGVLLRALCASGCLPSRVSDHREHSTLREHGLTVDNIINIRHHFVTSICLPIQEASLVQSPPKRLRFKLKLFALLLKFTQEALVRA